MAKTLIKLLVFVIIICFLYFVYFSIAINRKVGGKYFEKTFTIESGEGVNQISQNLKDTGLIRSKWNFELYLWLKDMEGDLKAGDHLLNTEMSAVDVSRSLVEGDIVQERAIRTIEGWNNKQVAEYFEKSNVSSGQEFLNIVENYEFINRYDFLESKPQELDLEGYLFPDTYRIFTDATVGDVVEKMLMNFDEKLSPKMRLDIKSQGRTIHDVITLASIIEKEVATDKDRALVSDVFMKRLEIGMALQADSTVNYVLGTSDAAVSFNQLREADSPYNTYKHKDLPPGPICNPGLSSIKAAIYPEENDHWYFLTTDEGEVIYSKTNDEHAANKVKYLK